MNNSFFDFKIIPLPESGDLGSHQRGKNGKNILILMGSTPEKDELSSFLQKILAAIDIDLVEDTAFIDLPAAREVNISDLISKYAPRACLIFGLEPASLGIRFQLPRYQIVDHQACRYLRADDLQEIYEERQRGEKERSVRLWKNLQKLPSW